MSAPYSLDLRERILSAWKGKEGSQRKLVVLKRKGCELRV